MTSPKPFMWTGIMPVQSSMLISPRKKTHAKAKRAWFCKISHSCGIQWVCFLGFYRQKMPLEGVHALQCVADEA